MLQLVEMMVDDGDGAVYGGIKSTTKGGSVVVFLWKN